MTSRCHRLATGRLGSNPCRSHKFKPTKMLHKQRMQIMRTKLLKTLDHLPGKLVRDVMDMRAYATWATLCRDSILAQIKCMNYPHIIDHGRRPYKNSGKVPVGMETTNSTK